MSPDKSLLEEVALIKVGISEAFIEKDWFVTKVIRILSENQYLDFSIIFTGGTSLSKAHRLIERFSEDIDFRIVAPSLEVKSISKIRKELSDFKKHVIKLLEGDFQILKEDARDSNRHIMIDLAYPTVCEPAKALRPHIKLELTFSKFILPSVSLPVSSFINEVSSLPPEVKKIACINPVENAADKFSAVVWRIPSRERGFMDKQPDVVRHLHDLAKLSDRVLESSNFGNLVIETIQQDSNRAESIKNLSVSEKIAKMIDILETDPNYPKEYEIFVRGMSYAQDTSIPSFADAVKKIKLIASKVLSSME